MGRGVPAGLAQMGIERGDLVTLGGGAFKVTIVLEKEALSKMFISAATRPAPNPFDSRWPQATVV